MGLNDSYLDYAEEFLDFLTDLDTDERLEVIHMIEAEYCLECGATQARCICPGDAGRDLPV